MSGKILLVDDDEFVLEVRSRDLNDEGYEVITATGGYGAIKIAQNETFDIVVCDVRMPDLDGIETLRRIKAMQSDVRTIVITGYTSEKTPVDALKLGVNDYLIKPFEYEEFIAAVNQNMEYLRLKRENEALKEQLISDLRGELRALEEAERKRLYQEMQDARNMQMRLLPKSAPDIPSLEVAGICLPATEVGGDFYDYVPMNGSKDCVGIALADVSGKGLKAAMTAVMTNGMLHTQVKLVGARSPRPYNASEVLSELNTTLYPRLEPLMNTAMCFCLIDMGQKTLQYANAGIPFALLRRGDDLMELELGGAPLGARRDFRYEQREIDLQTGDLLVLFTDGVTEAMNEDGAMYQETDRLKERVSQFDHCLSPQALIDAILADVRDFVGAAELGDDMTVVVAKICGEA
ncbi:SpoIIE family protein phosphatase [Candidatus Poribacteria bacterium]|nr:SpoIIE family protein phosphatase [Candidatus Poribacteria bacterium]